jgi:hypothetical protein
MRGRERGWRGKERKQCHKKNYYYLCPFSFLCFCIPHLSLSFSAHYVRMGVRERIYFERNTRTKRKRETRDRKEKKRKERKEDKKRKERKTRKEGKTRKERKIRKERNTREERKKERMKTSKTE